MFKTSIIVILLFISLLASSQKAHALEKASGSSATLANESSFVERDMRAQTLQKYLEAKGSPMASSAATFVREADKNNLDWRLVAAISGVESNHGKFIPYNSYNGWGWGVYGDNVINFASWDEAIVVISKSLRKDYMDKWNATNVEEMGKIYAADPNWSIKVRYFMNKIEEFEANDRIASLPISL